MPATVHILPDRADRRRDEQLLALMSLVESLGVSIIDPEELTLADFIAAPSAADRRAFDRIAGVI